mmetsp:Transcript_17210/g.49112  ORF Transcript_17210/g.49112 Transcript_17210/m.49112 type:complete len:428 (+) Transcript_17210:1105-2388(+)
MQSSTAGAVVSSQDASLGGGGPGGGSVGLTEAGRGASSVHADSKQGNKTPRKTSRHVSAPNSLRPSRSSTLLRVANAALRTFSRGSATSRARPSKRGHHSSSCASSGGGSFSGPSGRSPSRDAEAALVAARIDPSASARAHASNLARASSAVADRASSFELYEAKEAAVPTTETKSGATNARWWSKTRPRASKAACDTARSGSPDASFSTPSIDFHPDLIFEARACTKTSRQATMYARTGALSSDPWFARNARSKGFRNALWNVNALSSSLAKNLSDSWRSESTTYVATSAFAWAPALAKCAARTRHMRSQANLGLKCTFISATSTNLCNAATRGRLGSPNAGNGCKSSYLPPGLRSDSSRKYCVPLDGSPVDSSAADTAQSSATNLSTPTADNFVERAYSSSSEASVSTECAAKALALSSSRNFLS